MLWVSRKWQVSPGHSDKQCIQDTDNIVGQKPTTPKKLIDTNKPMQEAGVESPKTLTPEGRYLEQSPHKHRSNSKEVSQRVSKWNPVADGLWNSLPVQYRERQVTRGDRGTQTTGWSGRIAGGKHGSAGGCDYADEHGHRFDIDQHEVLAGMGAWAK